MLRRGVLRLQRHGGTTAAGVDDPPDNPKSDIGVGFP
jgi:hypothetical protein